MKTEAAHTHTYPTHTESETMEWHGISDWIRKLKITQHTLHLINWIECKINNLFIHYEEFDNWNSYRIFHVNCEVNSNKCCRKTALRVNEEKFGDKNRF